MHNILVVNINSVKL